MVMVGTDVHKYNHCAQAVDDVGRPLSVCNVKATDAGHRELVAWARREFGDAEVTFAVEDCRQMSTRLERALPAAGFRVVRVLPNPYALIVPGADLGQDAGARTDRAEDLGLRAGGPDTPACPCYRLARGGNRQLNAALHRIALTQMRLEGPGREYYQRRRASGDSHNDAMRALNRRLARVVYGLLRGGSAAVVIPQAA